MITIRSEKAGSRYSLEIDGHAQYCKKNDIVCAGVSGIYYALVAALAQDRRVKKLSHSEQAGKAKTVFDFSEKECDFFKMAIRGMALISDAYPKNVRIIYKKRKG